jgi:hypothetical protein
VPQPEENIMQADTTPIHASNEQQARPATPDPTPSTRTVAVALLVDRVLGA